MNTQSTTPQRPLILVSNDDGIQAPGVRRLIDMLLPLADIVCVCPLYPQSGMSMAITVNRPLRITRFDDYRGVAMYAVDGTPVDCVKLARHALLDRLPDMVVAGINHGSNAGINLIYSGTMGATMEGCVLGIPSVGFSLTNHSMKADFSPCEPFVKKIVGDLLHCGLPKGVCLNVNIPDCSPAPTAMKLVRQCNSNWSDEYKQYTDPSGKPFYMLSGCFENEEADRDDTDEWCMSNGVVAVVPVELNRSASFPGMRSTEIAWTEAQLAALRSFNIPKIG